MTKVQIILHELSRIHPDELELIMAEIKNRIDKKRRAESALNEYVGKGKGVWNCDAQEYIKELRTVVS